MASWTWRRDQPAPTRDHAGGVCVFVDHRMPSLTRPGMEPVVTDQRALAAHQYWHRMTGGIWSNYFGDAEPDEIPLEAVRTAGGGFRSAAASGVEARSRETGISGSLLELHNLDQSSSVWSDAGAASAGTGAELRICFAHRIMKVWVDFRVLHLSPGRFRVHILRESRQRTIRDVVVMNVQALLNTELVGTGAEVGQVDLSEIQDGYACRGAQRAARERLSPPTPRSSSTAARPRSAGRSPFQASATLAAQHRLQRGLVY
eukprot:TRINITY_DN55362_c0_g1_i1.p2 TRINITY_DN55362_c0_g1~~TRINITY_DN55362_c0_g1_i1.p2  ORF type:complete len:284 (+),score=45.80 TRINITY_DN55362_c0_g1_i1:75-854(+)